MPAASLTFREWFVPGRQLPAPWNQRMFRLSAGWQMLAALLLNLLSLAVPVLMLQVYDRIIPHRSISTLVLLILGVSVALFMDCALRLLRSWLVGWSAASFEHAAGCAAIERMNRAPLVQVEQNSTGVQLHRLAALGRLRDHYAGQALSATIDLPFATLFLALIAYLAGPLALVPVVLLALFFLFARITGQRLKMALEQRAEMDDRRTNLLVSLLTGMHTVKAFGMEQSLLRRFEACQSDTTRASYRVALATASAASLGALFAQLSLLATVTAGSILVMAGHLSVGGLSACTLLAGRALQPVQRVLGTWLRLQDVAVARAQSAELFVLEPQARTLQALPPATGKVVIERMSFGYGETNIFTDLSLDIAPGSAIAIEGEQASGKSTLLQLMAGTLPPSGGEVRVDGIVPSHHDLSTLRGHIGYLPPQAAIFRGSILDNLTGFRRDEYSLHQAREAARSFGLDAVVDGLPNGYATLLGDHNSDPVSPGVKQRIALARIFAQSPKLVLFDDADRALDKEGYNALFRLIGRLKQQCSLVIVSHDQNLLSFADRFYRIESCRLVQTRGVQDFLSLLEA